MSSAPTKEQGGGEVGSRNRGGLRVWPGVVLVGLQWVLMFVVPRVLPEQMAVAVMSGLGAGAGALIWWVFFSKASWPERGVGLAAIVGALMAARFYVHESIAEGMMGLMPVLYGLPLLTLPLVVWALLSRRTTGGRRLLSLVGAIAVGALLLSLFRTGGLSGSGSSELAWRWAPTPEERLLEADDAVTSALSEGLGIVQEEAEWPGFRGPGHDGIVSGTDITLDWAASPPTELWRRPVGPGWSSFAVFGNLVVTQEQRGEEEAVSCYDLTSGEPIWRHTDEIRFWESNAGAGPRGTPAIHDGRVYALGATGRLNALDVLDGSTIWSRDVAAETETEVPMWGFSGSPIVAGDRVLVAAAGTLAAYGLESGEPAWVGPAGGDGYSSPRVETIDGVEQVLQLGSTGLTSYDLATGAILWSHEWKGYPIVQPARTADGDILLSVTDRSGLRRLSVSMAPGGGWDVEERWTSHRLKPYFNDFVVHEGHAYGFDGSILAAIDLEEGERQWKGGRYGHGQMVLLADQDVLLVLTEQGELALVRALPDGFAELARIPAIEGKTWNHPVLVGDTLLVRNDREMAAFQLSSG